MILLPGFRITTRWIVLASVSVLWSVGGAAEARDDDGKRGLRRLVPRPFKKEPADKPEPEPEVVKDMREFAAQLTGQTPILEKPDAKPAAPRSVNVAEPEPEPAPEAASEVKVTVAPKEKRRRGLIPRPFGGRDEKAPLPATPELAKDDKPRSKILRVPFFGGRDEKAPSDVVETVDERSRLIRIPMVGGDDLPETSELPPEVTPDELTKVEPEEERKSRRWRSPFSKYEAPVVVEDATEKKQRQPLDMPKTEPSPVEEKAAPKKKEKKGGFFSKIANATKIKDSPPAPAPSTRDLGIGDKYVVSVGGTPFYSISPNQPLPPDEILSLGAVVTMRKAGWGWSDIELPGGRMGVVASKNLRKATISESGGSFASRRGGGSTRGLFKVFDFDPTPEPELPSDSGGLPLGVGLLPPLDNE